VWSQTSDLSERVGSNDDRPRRTPSNDSGTRVGRPLDVNTGRRREAEDDVDEAVVMAGKKSGRRGVNRHVGRLPAHTPHLPDGIVRL
jgi:hypothetical protein